MRCSEKHYAVRAGKNSLNMFDSIRGSGLGIGKCLEEDLK